LKGEFPNEAAGPATLATDIPISLSSLGESKKPFVEGDAVNFCFMAPCVANRTAAARALSEAGKLAAWGEADGTGSKLNRVCLAVVLVREEGILRDY
jgi:hypothetical protein